MRKKVLMVTGAVALAAMVFYPANDIFAHGGQSGKPHVRSSLLKGSRCKTHNNFKTTDVVQVSGEHFPESTPVDIYITRNIKWDGGETIADFQTAGTATVTVTTDDSGDFDCTEIWTTPQSGQFDIVVDANQNGLFDDGDGIDGRRSNRGFRVR